MGEWVACWDDAAGSVQHVIWLGLVLSHMPPPSQRVVSRTNHPQGMDHNNERAVFQLIVDACARDVQSPQYIVLTPKLLSNLKYQPHCRVHIVFNGTYVDNRLAGALTRVPACMLHAPSATHAHARDRCSRVAMPCAPCHPGHELPPSVATTVQPPPALRTEDIIKRKRQALVDAGEDPDASDSEGAGRSGKVKKSKHKKQRTRA